MRHLKLCESPVLLEQMSLYPTLDSVTEAITFIEAQVPLNTANEVFGLLMIYHNSLLKQLNDNGRLVP